MPAGRDELLLLAAPTLIVGLAAMFIDAIREDAPTLHVRELRVVDRWHRPTVADLPDLAGTDVVVKALAGAADNKDERRGSVFSRALRRRREGKGSPVARGAQ